MTTEFIKTKGRRTIQGIQDPEIDSLDNVAKLEELLQSKVGILKKSELVESIFKSFKDNDLKITKIRCLALGSPSLETPALYQLALLHLLIEQFGVQTKYVSLYDPVFTKLDKKIFSEKGYIVEEEYESNEVPSTLFFLPHAPLKLTDIVISSSKPSLLLANNISTHTERLGKLELYNKYPLLSKLVHLLEKDLKDSTVERRKNTEDDFQPVVSKRKSRKSKHKYVEPSLDYSSVASYFSSISIVSFKKDEEGEWNNSFTDLAFHRLA